MRKNVISAISLVTVLAGLAGTLAAQVSLNRIPSRAVGQPQLTLATRNPNLVEGREFYGPHAAALDNSVNPPVLYVSDTLNNRVLGWRSGIAFSNGAKADFVIGQKDFFSTARLGPGTAFNSGFNLPTGITVDRNGNLYVVDTGNNRIVRFPRPYAQTDQLPNLVIGQTSLSCSNCNLPNSGGLSAKTIFVGNNGVTLTTSIIFDSQGNLWFTDSGNNRVLRYPASVLGENAANGPAADLVLGQFEFDANTAPAATIEGLKRLDALYQPQGLVFDPSGRLYVSDSPPFNRVLVYQPNLSPSFDRGRPALRIMGLPPPRTGTAPVPLINEVQFVNPTGLFMIGRQVGVVDSYQHRLLLFDPYELWPADLSLSPHGIASTGPTGQFGYSTNKPNRDLPEPRNNSFSFPSTALVVSNELYVVDSGNNRLLVYSTNNLGQNGSAIRVLGQDGFDFGAANLLEGREVNFSPTNNNADGGIWIDTTSDVPHLYIADTYNHRVLGYRDVRQVRPGDKADLVIGQPDFQRSVINYPSNDKERPNAQGLYNPVGLAVDSDGNLFVADAGNGRVLRFPRPFDQPRLNFPSADLVLGQSSLTATKVIDPTQRTMRSPYGLAFTSDGALLVSDSVLNRVLLFQNKPQPFTDGMAASKVFGQPDFGSFAFGSETNQMSAPKHIATDSDDRIYVADENNSRLLIFDNVVFAPSSNVRAGTIIEGPNKDSRFAGIRGVFVNKNTGEFWITEVNAPRVLRFPKFDDLLFRPRDLFDFQIGSNNGVAVTQDSFGDLFVAEFTNRVAIYYPGLTAVNAANPIKDQSGKGRPLAPGAIVMASRSGARFANEVTVADPANWPMELSDIQVLVDDSPAPIRDVKIDELNFLMPMSAPPGGTVELQVVRKSTGQILGAGPVDMAVASPALFTEGPIGTGIGQIVANNEDGSRNQPSRPIGRGKVISLFGTGVGFVPGAPPDGQAPASPIPAPQGSRIFMGSRFIEDSTDCKPSPCIVFSGLAPGQVGVWQIDVKVPDFVAPSPGVQVFIQLRSINSIVPGQQTTIAVSQQ